MARALGDLNPTELENLTFDLLQQVGMENLVWRTPGADGGRDLEGIDRSIDVTGAITSQRWYIECKRYSNSVDWPTVWKKLAYAESQGADCFLLVTNSNPSPRCETEIADWNRLRGKVKVRFWRGYELTQILLGYPDVAAKYGLHLTSGVTGVEFEKYTNLIMKMVQSAHVAIALEGNSNPALEAAASLVELMSLRVADIRRLGRYARGSKADKVPEYVWLDWSGPHSAWEEAGLRALLSLTHYLSGARRVEAVSEAASCVIRAKDAKVPFSDAALSALREVALLSHCDIQSVTPTEWAYEIAPSETA